jgi:cytochrome c peroxidase
VRVPARVMLVAAVVSLAAGLAAGNHAGAPLSHPADDPHKAVLSAAIRSTLESQLDALVGSLDSLAAALGTDDHLRAERLFRAARVSYKRAECLLAAYSPPTVAALNGPAAESDGDAPPPALGAPAAFQQIEGALFHPGASRVNSVSSSRLRAIAVSMSGRGRTFRSQTELVSVGEAALLDAVRAEVARVGTLGIAGADTDRPTDIAVESAASLEGMVPLVNTAARVASGHASVQAWNATAVALRAAAAQLRVDPEFQRVDRLAFIAGYVGSIARSLGAVRAALPPSQPSLRRAWRPAAASVFDSGAFDASAYAPEYAPAATGALVALGKRLFFDPRLSGPQTRSCASCHDPSRAFTDGRARALTLYPAAQAMARNSPTLLNVALEPTLFADQRAGSLEEQVARVLSSGAEMQSSAELVATRLQGDTSYRAEFAGALTGRRDTAVTALGVRVALAAYVRSLVALNSRFDRAARGEAGVLTSSERRGFDLFLGKARCGTCHFMPLFSGVAPPDFVRSEPEVIGVPENTSARRLLLDGDPGRAGVDHAEAHRFAFKVPTLRNIALTAPYMHNGAFKSLEDVIDFYDRGGGVGAGLRVPNQTLSANPLRLRAFERRDLVAFLRTLTDTVVSRVR